MGTHFRPTRPGLRPELQRQPLDPDARRREVGDPGTAQSFSGITAFRHVLVKVALIVVRGQAPDYWAVRGRCGFSAYVDPHPYGSGCFHEEQPTCNRCLRLVAHDAGEFVENLAYGTADQPAVPAAIQTSV